MIATLKQDSKCFELEQAQRRRQYGQPGKYDKYTSLESLT
jgi:hypothetical protein